MDFVYYRHIATGVLMRAVKGNYLYGIVEKSGAYKVAELAAKKG